MRKMSAVALSCRSGRSPDDRRDGDDAREAEVGPETARSRPCGSAAPRSGGRSARRRCWRARTPPSWCEPSRAALLHAAHDAVGAGRGRDQDAVGVGLDPLGGGGEVDRRSRRCARSPPRRREQRNKPEQAPGTARSSAATARAAADLRLAASRAIHRSHEERVKSLELRRFRGLACTPDPPDLVSSLDRRRKSKDASVSHLSSPRVRG